MTLRWRNRDDVRRWFIFSAPISAEQHDEWYSKYQKNENDYVFIIEIGGPDDYVPVGQVSLYHIEWDRKRAEYGRLMIGEQVARGRGVGLIATKILLEYATQELDLREIYLSVFENNQRAIAIYEACGFVQTDHDNDLIQMTWVPASPPESGDNMRSGNSHASRTSSLE